MNATKKINHSEKLSSRDQFEPPKFRTQILGGYGLYRDKNGLAQLEEVLMETENMVVLGGTLFALEKMFGVRVAESSRPKTLNTLLGGIADEAPTDLEYLASNFVNLFAIGTGGSGDTINSVVDVNFIDDNVGDIIPFRLTSEPLSGAEAEQYWLKQPNYDSSGKTAYYLKKFESTPVIKALWDDGVGDADGTPVTPGSSEGRTEPIETFVEIILRVDKKDVVEYFTHRGEIELARVNSIGLVTGIKSTLTDGTEDYISAIMVSKFNFTNEMLSISKNLEFVYRIYTA